MGKLAPCLLGQIVVILVLAGSSVEAEGQGLFDDPHCFLTLSEKASVAVSPFRISARELELNWMNFNFPSYNGHWIGLFQGDPAQGSCETLESFPVENYTGYIKTKVRLEPMNFTDVKNETCLGDYWVGYYRAGDTSPFSSNCLRLFPTWMQDMKDIIGDKKLRKVMTPGTHDAGSWLEYDGTIQSDGLLARFLYTHEEPIYNQLVAGIRYLDVRIQYYPSTDGEVFWIIHGPIRIRELQTLLDDVQRFVQEFNEIVFMDFYSLANFESDATHEQLYEIVTESIGSFLVPKAFSTDVTFNELWAAGKYVILGYNNDFNQKRDLLWPSVTRAFGNKDTVPELRDYLPTAIATYGCTNTFWTQMAELTPNPYTILTNILYSTRDRAADANKGIVNVWYKRPEWYSKCHIIATDFFMGNDLVQTSVTVNRHGGNIC